jgi:hypothetical protein
MLAKCKHRAGSYDIPDRREVSGPALTAQRPLGVLGPHPGGVTSERLSGVDSTSRIAARHLTCTGLHEGAPCPGPNGTALTLCPKVKPFPLRVSQTSGGPRSEGMAIPAGVLGSWRGIGAHRGF